MQRCRCVEQARLRSSFIYLANAVGDLRANWVALAVVLAPLAAIIALCALPDALNLHHYLESQFGPGLHHVGWTWIQTPYMPQTEDVPPLFPRWVLVLFHIAILVLYQIGHLLMMITIKRVQTGQQQTAAVGEAMTIYRESARLIPGFLWIALLQYASVLVGFILLIVPGLLILIWLYFGKFALVFDGYRSFGALLRSRDLMRKRFFRVGARIMVMIATWYGYNWLTLSAVFGVGVVLGWIGLFVGDWSRIALVLLGDATGTAVVFGTTAFFVAAGARLYRDLAAMVPASGAARAAQTTAILPAVES